MDTPAGIIFDFNGVIIDDYAIQNEAWNHMSHILRGKPVTDRDMARQIRGMPTSQIITWMTPKKLSGPETAALSRQKTAITKRLFEEGPSYELTPGLDGLLDKLVKLNIPRTIATSQTRPVFLRLAEQLGLAKWFDVDNAVCYDGSYPGKPAPDAYILAAKAIGLPPAKCIVIEDARSGISAAYAAGVRSIIAIGKDESLQELQKLPGVVEAIRSFDELNVTSILGFSRKN